MFDTVFPRRVQLRAAPWLYGWAVRPSVWKDKTVVRWDDYPHEEETVWSSDIEDTEMQEWVA
jgi:hypothetical protein